MILDIPLMKNNITKEDREALIDFLREDRILTQSENVRAFEKEWSEWLGVKHSVFMSSGASANLLTMAALKHLYGKGEVIVPTLTWVSDIAAVIQNELKPVFVDIDKKTLGMKTEEVLRKITPQTKAIFLTHVLGYNALTKELLDRVREQNIFLVEDVCESHGATFQGKKVGTFGQVSNFSFYYAHHMSTIEGGVVCTNDENFYQTIRLLRSHGMVRESDSEAFRKKWQEENPEVHPEFIFAYPSYNVRSTELNAVIGRSQIKRLDSNNEKRKKNLALFLKNLDSTKYQTDFAVEGSCNYAFTLVLNKPDKKLCENVMAKMRDAKVEFRRGLSGGGNQLRQPFIRPYVAKDEYTKYPNIEHVHFYGFYIGNYPDLEEEKILGLCKLLNNA